VHAAWRFETPCSCDLLLLVRALQVQVTTGPNLAVQVDVPYSEILPSENPSLTTARNTALGAGLGEKDTKGRRAWRLRNNKEQRLICTPSNCLSLMWAQFACEGFCTVGGRCYAEEAPAVTHQVPSEGPSPGNHLLLGTIIIFSSSSSCNSLCGAAVLCILCTHWNLTQWSHCTGYSQGKD
jgi:hypothetical protein